MTNQRTNTEKNEVGRPTIYTAELGERICDLIATHPWGLKKICNTYVDLPTAETIRLWKLKNKEFFALYAKAKAEQADVLVEDILDTCDDTSKDYVKNDEGKLVFNSENYARTRLKVDSYKWLASKLLPKLYGDKLALEQQKSEKDEVLKEQMLQLRAHLDAKNKKDY